MSLRRISDEHKKDTRASSQITHAEIARRYLLCVRALRRFQRAHAARYRAPRARSRGWRLAAQTQTNPTKNAQKEIAPTRQGLEEFVATRNLAAASQAPPLAGFGVFALCSWLKGKLSHILSCVCACEWTRRAAVFSLFFFEANRIDKGQCLRKADFLPRECGYSSSATVQSAFVSIWVMSGCNILFWPPLSYAWSLRWEISKIIFMAVGALGSICYYLFSSLCLLLAYLMFCKSSALILLLWKLLAQEHYTTALKNIFVNYRKYFKIYI